MSDFSVLDIVPFASREQVVVDDFIKMQKLVAKNAMDILLTSLRSHTGFEDHDVPCVLGGFNVLDVTDLSVKIGEGMGFVLDRQENIPPEDEGTRSRANLVSIIPSQHEEEMNFETILIDSNPSSLPRFVLIYGVAATEDTTVNRTIYDPTSKRFTSEPVTKVKSRSISLHTENGANQAIPILPSEWSPMFGTIGQEKLPLYAVYCPPFMGEAGGPAFGDILDMRFFYSKKTSGLYAQNSIDRNPNLETMYRSSNDVSGPVGSTYADNEKIRWKSFNASTHGQEFVISAQENNAWENSDMYIPDPSLIEDINNRKNRPIYWYALPPIGTIAPNIYGRRGIVTCIDEYLPTSLENTPHIFTLTTNNPDHKYQLRTFPIFMGSLPVGEVGASDEHKLLGCKRSGETLFITEQSSSPVAYFNPTTSKYGMPLDYGAWPANRTIDLFSTPDDTTIRFIPESCTSIILQAGIRVKENLAPIHVGDTLRLFVSMTSDDNHEFEEFSVIFNVGHTLVCLPQTEGNGELIAIATNEIPVIASTAGRKAIITSQGDLGEADGDQNVGLWSILMLAYKESVL